MNRSIVTAVIGIIVIILAISLNYVSGPPDDATTAVVSEKPKQATTPEAMEPAPPTFDVVRVNPNGDAVMAGRAAADSTVDIIDNDADMGRIKTDPRGEWVFVPEQPLKPGKHRLSLIMKIDGKAPIKSTSDVVLVVPERGKDIAGQAGDGDSIHELRIMHILFARCCERHVQ